MGGKKGKGTTYTLYATKLPKGVRKMRFKVGEPKMVGWLAEDGASINVEVILEEKELFALLAGYDISTGGGFLPIGENIAVLVTIKREQKTGEKK